MKFPHPSCAGMAVIASRPFSNGYTRRSKRKIPRRLVTYVNFPTTEYLQLPFVDFVSFNVYLETQEKLEGYLARLQNLAGDRPLVMAEIGLDSMRNGEDAQADPGMADPFHLRGRLRRNLRLCLDRRMASRWL